MLILLDALLLVESDDEFLFRLVVNPVIFDDLNPPFPVSLCLLTAEFSVIMFSCCCLLATTVGTKLCGSGNGLLISNNDKQ